MKFGTENKKKVYLTGGLMVVALLVVFNGLRSMGWLGETTTTAASVRTPQNTTAASASTSQKKGVVPRVRENTLDPTLRTDILAASQRMDYEGGKRNIFRVAEPPPPPPTPIPTPVQPVRIEPQGPPPPPPPPPITLKFYGFANRAGEAKKVFLSDGDEVFVAREGDIVNRRYKILQISNTSVMVEDVLNNNRQPVPLTAAPQ